MKLNRFFGFAVLILILAAGMSATVRSLAAAGPALDSEPVPYSDDWRATGPPGGDVRALVVDQKDPSRFYFGTLDGQIYTSADGARTWRLLYNFNIPRLFVDHVMIDPRDQKSFTSARIDIKSSVGFLSLPMAVTSGIRAGN